MFTSSAEPVEELVRLAEKEMMVLTLVLTRTSTPVTPRGAKFVTGNVLEYQQMFFRLLCSDTDLPVSVSVYYK